MPDLAYSTDIEDHPDFPGIKRFVDSNLDELIMKAAAQIPQDKHLMVVPFLNGTEAQLAAVARLNGSLSAMGVFRHTWAGKNDFEVAAIWTPF